MLSNKTIGIIRLPLVLGAILATLGCFPKNQASSGDMIGLLGPDEEDIFNEEGFPVVKEPITLTAVVARNPMHGDFNEMPSIMKIEEKAGINLEFDQVPSSSYSEKLNLIFASGDLPDIVFYGEPNNLMSYAGELVRPLDDYIDRYMPNLLSVFTERPQYRRFLVRSDGNIYQLLRSEEYSQIETPNNLFINKLWLDNLGLDIPQTTEDFYQVLKAFKEQDPNGNGQADEIPFTSLDNGWSVMGSLYSLGGSFFFPADSRKLKVGSDGQLEYVPISEAEGFQRFVEYYQRLYREGLLDTEAFVQSQGELLAKGKEKILGSFTAWLDENVVGADTTKDYVMLKPLSEPGGKPPRWFRSANAFQARDAFLLPTTNAYPAATMRMMDLTYDPDYAWQLIFGPWDVNIERLPDGRVRFLDPPEGLSWDEWRWNNAPVFGFPFALLEDERTNESILPQSPAGRKQARHEILQPFLPPIDEYLPLLSFTIVEETELSTLSTDINDYFNQQYTNWITQNVDVREVWPGFINQLEEIGIDRYIEIHQAAYDRYIAN